MKQIPRRITDAKLKAQTDSRRFNYTLDYKRLNLREYPELYRVGVGEQGVLLVEPYKSEILGLWRFRTPAIAKVSAAAIFEKFEEYKRGEDFVGMDMARKFLQMGYTRSRRYANHKSGRKYGAKNKVLEFQNDDVKAKSAEIFKRFWRRAEQDEIYADLKMFWRAAFG